VKNKVLSYLLLILMLPLIAASQKLTTDEIDEFTGKRKISTSAERLDWERPKGRAYTYPNYIDGDIFLMLYVLSTDSWQLLRANHADFIIDDIRQRHELHRVSTDVQRGTTSELYAFILSLDELKVLRDASTVKFRAGGNVYGFNEKVKSALEIFIDRVERE
jgi:hypothetical protein